MTRRRIATIGKLSSIPVLVLLSVTACAQAPGAGPDAESDVIATLESFYGAMKAGDAAKVMSSIASDAVFVESGRLETRAEYEMNHLPADIEFEGQVPGRRGPWQVKVEGDTAWAIATTDFEGTFNGNPVNIISTQLAVLTRQDDRWSIRSIHWSSRRP